MKPTRIVQANLHRSRTATAHIIQAMDRGVVDVALLQEPNQVEGRVRDLGSAYNVYYVRGCKKVRTCIIAQKFLQTVFVPELSDKDTTTVRWNYKTTNGGDRAVLLSSVYLPYEDDDPATPGLRRICRDATTEKLLGCDSNSHNSLWGSTDTNRRGERLLDFFISTNLELLNRGDTPTFITRAREEVIDISLATPGFRSEIGKWKVESLERGLLF